MSESSDNEFVYCELAGFLPGGGMDRNHWVRADEPLRLVEFRQRFVNKDIFMTPARFAFPDRTSLYISDFFLDIDAEDSLEEAKQDALKACGLLQQLLEIDANTIERYFSGCRGFHVTVPFGVFGNEASPHLMAALRIWAEEITRGGVKHIDLGVYQPARLLRLPGSINSKSGLHKIPLWPEELEKLSVEEIRQAARQPRQIEVSSQPRPSTKASQWFQETLARLERQGPGTLRLRRPYKFKDGWRVPPCVRNIHGATLPDNLRHTAYLALARFYGWINMHPEEAAERLHTIDSRHPIRDPGYIERAVDYGKQQPGFAGCRNVALRRYCEPEKCFLTTLHDQKGQGK